MLLSRDAILKASDLPTRDVSVSEWGGVVRVRMLTGAERDAFEASFAGDGPGRFANMRARLVALCAVGPDGRRLFDEADVIALGAKSGAALNRVFLAAQELSCLRPEDLEKKSAPSANGRTDDSFSDSASASASPIPTT